MIKLNCPRYHEHEIQTVWSWWNDQWCTNCVNSGLTDLRESNSLHLTNIFLLPWIHDHFRQKSQYLQKNNNFLIQFNIQLNQNLKTIIKKGKYLRFQLIKLLTIITKERKGCGIKRKNRVPLRTQKLKQKKILLFKFRRWNQMTLKFGRIFGSFKGYNSQIRTLFFVNFPTPSFVTMSW